MQLNKTIEPFNKSELNVTSLAMTHMERATEKGFQRENELGSMTIAL